MDSLQRLDFARYPYAGRQPPSLVPTTTLSSGKSYYTVESLEGVSSLPPLKPRFTPPPFPSERDTHYTQTRDLLDRDPLDAHQRGALQQQNAPFVDRSAYSDGLPHVDTSALSHFDSQSLDTRARFLERDAWPGDGLRRALDNRTRAPAPMDGLALGPQEHRSSYESISTRELALDARNEAASFRPMPDYLHSGRDTADFRALATPLDSSLTRREIASRPSASSFLTQSERHFSFGKQEPADLRPILAEPARKQKDIISDVKAAHAKLKKIKPPPEQSEGWCAVCKIDCHNVKTLDIHVAGKKHKAIVEGNSLKANESLAEGKSTLTVTSQLEKKRASDANLEAPHNAKRPKISAVGSGTSAVHAPDTTRKGKADDAKKEKAKVPVTRNGIGNGTPNADAFDTKKGNADDSRLEKGKSLAAKDGNSLMLVCEVCNVSTTSQKDLGYHLKGKRHAARVEELAYAKC